MKFSLGAVFIFAVLFAANVVAQSETFTSKDIPGNFTEEKPDYLYFKEITVTPGASNSYQFEATLCGKVPSNLKDKIEYYIGFDVDNDSSTGSAKASSKSFGQDIWAYFTKNKGTSRFEEWSSSFYYRGKNHELKISGFKISGDKISFKVRSELFGYNESSKFFMSASIIRYDGGREISDIQVDTLGGKITKAE